MFKLPRPRSGRTASGERFSFHFSNFQAVQVPEGWDKLSIALVSMRTGKTIAKLGKATMSNESCQWTETLTECILVSQDEGKEIEESLLKFVVAMGTTRAATLGEANINLVRYISSNSSVPLSLPLSKCDHGTILQLKIQCQTPRTNFREYQKTDPNSSEDYPIEDDEMEAKSDLSDNAFSRNIGSSSRNHMEHTNEDELLSREHSFSRSGSQLSFDSAEGSSGKNSYSPQHKSTGTANSQIRRQDSSDSENSTPTHNTSSTEDCVRSNNSFNLKPQQAESAVVVSSSQPDAGSSKNSMEISQVSLKKELSEKSIKAETLEMELSASQEECESLKKEISQLKLMLEETTMNNDKNIGEKKLQIRDVDYMRTELENEIKFLKESNTYLGEQVQKTQDSNAELLSILQELEGIVETQKADILQLSSEKLKLEEMLIDNNSDEESPEHRNLQTKLQHFLEEQEKLQSSIRVLEAKLESRNREVERERRLKDQALLECESKWKSMLDEKEEEIVSLEEQITQCFEDQGGQEPDSDFPQEAEFLKSKLEELERECTELVEENMQLVLKLKEAKKNSSEAAHPDDRFEHGSQVSSLQKEIEQLKESKYMIETEKNSACQQLDDRLYELESLEAANKVLERKSSDLEKGKEELELHLSKLEEKNIQLSEKISDLEAWKRLITDEKEACHHKLKHSNRDVKKLRGEIIRLEGEIEAQKIDSKQKLHDMQNRWLEAQEEYEYLKKANPKLQVTVGNLMDECHALQTLNADLKMQNKELQKYRSILEAQVNDSEKKNSKCCSTIEALEGEFSTMLEVMAMKEESIRSQLESLISENKNLKEKVAAEEKVLNQMYLEKSLEVENLQKELVHLLDQISTLYAGNAEFPSEAIVELCSLRVEKSKLEISLEEFREKFASSEKKLNARQLEAEAKVVELMSELSSSRQKNDVLVADHKKLKVKLQNAKSGKKKCKSVTRDLESKLKVSEHEKLHLEEEISVLKKQQHKASQLQDEIVTFKISLDEANFELKKLHTSFDLLSGDHKKLESERAMLDQKVRSTETALSDLEDYKCRKAVMEEKILRLEEELNAREALCAQDAEMKIELGKIERLNNELLRKIKYLEEDREEYLKKIKASDGHSEDVMADYLARIQSLENELSKALEAEEMYHSQLSRFLSDEQTTSKPSAKQNGANAKVPDSLVWNLQLELKDIRERYFQMSLKYAEVEAQREELVMKLKSKNNKKSWFS